MPRSIRRWDLRQPSVWCHNPEGLSRNPELYVKTTRCISYGLCRQPCAHDECRPYGRCLHVCPNNLISIVGKEWDSERLAEKMLESKSFFYKMGGGVTVFGGESLMQSNFTYDFLKRLDGIHRAIETSGYANPDAFQQICSVCDLVIIDIKLPYNKLAPSKYKNVGRVFGKIGDKTYKL